MKINVDGDEYFLFCTAQDMSRDTATFMVLLFACIHTALTSSV